MFSISGETKRTKRIVFLILAIFLFACIIASVCFNEELVLGSFEEFDNDDVKYLRSAQTLLDTGKLTYNYPEQSTVFIMPGIVLLVTPFVAIFGMEGAILPIRIFFILLQTFNLYVVFLMARKVFNTTTAIITLVLSLFYLSNMFVATTILTETPTYTCFLIVMYLVIWGTEKKKKSYFITAGIMWGISVMFRPTMLALPAVIFVYWLLKKVKFSKMVIYGLCALVPLICIMTPWVVRNYNTFDRFIPLTLSSGNPKLQGTFMWYSEESTKESMQAIDVSDLKYIDNEIAGDEVQNKIASRVFEYNIKNNTLEYVFWYTIGKTAANFYLPYMWHPLFFVSYVPSFAYHIVLMLMFIVAVCWLKKTKKNTPEILLLLIMVLFFNCLHLPYYCFPRYVYPIMCFILMIDAHFICHLWDKRKSKKASEKLVQ